MDDQYSYYEQTVNRNIVKYVYLDIFIAYLFRLFKVYYCAFSESVHVRTTKNWIDRTLFKSKEKFI